MYADTLSGPVKDPELPASRSDGDDELIFADWGGRSRFRSFRRARTVPFTNSLHEKNKFFFMSIAIVFKNGDKSFSADLRIQIRKSNQDTMYRNFYILFST